MNAQTKESIFKIILIALFAYLLAVTLAIPGMLFYKLAHGAQLTFCLSILAGYILSFMVLLFLLARFKKHSAICGVLFGICYFALLYLSWKL
jgi:hypothetical protein